MISQAGLLTINPNISLPVCDQLARDGVIAKDLQKISFSFYPHSHLGGSSWHFASPKYPRETTHLARSPDIASGTRASRFSVAGGGAAGVTRALRSGIWEVSISRSRSPGMTQHAGDTPQGDCRGREPLLQAWSRGKSPCRRWKSVSGRIIG